MADLEGGNLDFFLASRQRKCLETAFGISLQDCYNIICIYIIYIIVYTYVYVYIIYNMYNIYIKAHRETGGARDRYAIYNWVY